MHDNPFVHELKLTNRQKLQVALMTVTIFPIRLLLVILGFTVVWLLALLFTIGAKPNARISLFRSFLYRILQLCGRIIFVFMGFHHFKIKGKRLSFEEAPILIVVPHSSLWDILIFFVSAPFPCALSKVENFHIPVFGTLMKAVQPILVHRDNDESKLSTVNEIKKRVSSKSWPQLVVFPEGTCTNKSSQIKFKVGAFLAGTPVQPIILRYKNNIDISTWTEVGPSAFYLIWLSMCQISLQTEIEYLPVYQPSQEEIEDPKLYAYNMQLHLSKLQNVPMSEHTYEDRLLMRQAKKLKLPKECAVLQFHKISKQLHITFKDATERLEEFAQICSQKGTGVADAQDLANYLQVSLTLLLTDIYNRFDGDNAGTFTFYQYVVGYYSIVNEMTAEAIRSAVSESASVFDICTSLLTNSNFKEIWERSGLDVSSITEELLTDFMTANPLYGMSILLHFKRMSKEELKETHQSTQSYLHQRK